MKPAHNEHGKLGYKIIKYTIPTKNGDVYIIASVDINREGNFEVLKEGYWVASTVNAKITKYCRENENYIKYHSKYKKIINLIGIYSDDEIRKIVKVS